MYQVKTLFFATLRDRAGVRTAELQIPSQTNIADFKSILVEEFPMLNGLMEYSLVSINQEYACDKTMIPDNAEIAVFPSVSGG